ncbi:MAG: terminase [Allobaculum sp.]|nr:terminase [Allobaculum sp.]
MSCCKLPFFVQVFWNDMDAHPEEYGEDIWKLRQLVNRSFEQDDLIVREDLAKQYLGLQEYFPWRLIPCQIFTFCMWTCVFWKETGLPRWPIVFIMGGRGFGKDGTIAFSSFALVSPYNPAERYDIDICATNEEQALRPCDDIREVLEAAENTAKLKRFYKWTKERITGLKNKGVIRGRTNNPSGRDGMRSGAVIFNELHEYPNYKNIEVFRTGLGKKKHPRMMFTTTDGYVVGGPLDDYKARATKILNGEEPDKGWLPILFRLTDEKDILDPSKWRQANPRLRYSPELQYEYENEFEDYKNDPDKNTSFATKRMNFRKTNTEVHITKWENILATNQSLIKLDGLECTCGIDYAKTSDWVAINLHFKVGEDRYDLNHAFVCTNGNDFLKLNCPHDEWERRGLITYVDAPDISPEVVADYLRQNMKRYRIKCLAIDSYRWTLLSGPLGALGFTLKNKNLKLVRPSDLMKTVPLIDSCFQNRYFHWEDQPVLRWATNNAKLIRSTASKIAIEGNLDAGNFLYGKIEPVKRKTDPFMALVASMTVEDQLTGYKPSTKRLNFGVNTY